MMTFLRIACLKYDYVCVYVFNVIRTTDKGQKGKSFIQAILARHELMPYIYKTLLT